LRDPRSIGAIAPSSTFLADEIVSGIDLAKCRTVLEYGPGTGALTSRVLDAVSPDCRVLAIEMNPRFAEDLRSRFPQLEVHVGNVADVRAICDLYGIEQADCIVAGLPWAVFSEEMQREFLDAMMTVLKPGGRFATFAYVQGLLMPPARRFARLLKDHFTEVKRGRVVWRNIPPAFVYRCRR
jgi:phosphatidylethanolamine/phosphatidyl-N-methylethanolamine N-methyltransferase